jgi:hypothetical protein
MPVKHAAAVRNARLNSMTTLYNSGTIEVRTGSAPTNTTDSDSGTLLATLAFGATAFASASSGTMSANAITPDSLADAAGTPGHYRVKQNGTGTVLEQGSCGVTANSTSGDLQFNQDIALGGEVSISAWTYTEGNA